MKRELTLLPSSPTHAGRLLGHGPLGLPVARPARRAGHRAAPGPALARHRPARRPPARDDGQRAPVRRRVRPRLGRLGQGVRPAVAQRCALGHDGRARGAARRRRLPRGRRARVLRRRHVGARARRSAELGRAARGARRAPVAAPHAAPHGPARTRPAPPPRPRSVGEHVDVATPHHQHCQPSVRHRRRAADQVPPGRPRLHAQAGRRRRRAAAAAVPERRAVGGRGSHRARRRSPLARASSAPRLARDRQAGPDLDLEHDHLGGAHPRRLRLPGPHARVPLRDARTLGAPRADAPRARHRVHAARVAARQKRRRGGAGRARRAPRAGRGRERGGEGGKGARGSRG